MATHTTAAPAAFDEYRASYDAVVQDSIGFSGLKHAVFLQAKVDLLADLFAAHFGTAARPSLLDVGCGVGLMHGRLRPLLRSLAGTDLSREALDRAAAENPDVEYRPQEGCRLPFPDAAFDATLAVCVFHHVEPTARDSLLSEMRRATRPGGLTVIIEHNPWNPGTRLAVARCPFDHDALLLGARASRALLVRGGYRDVRSRHFLMLPWASPISRAVEGAFRALPVGAQYAAYGSPS